MPLPLHRLLVFAVLLALLLAGRSEAANRYPFSVTSERYGQEHVLIAHNRGPAFVSVRIMPNSSSNLASNQAWPLYAVIRPYQDQDLAHLTPQQGEQGTKFSLQITFRTGNMNARHDEEALYRPPFANGRTFVVSQAAGGPISTHKSPDSEYAIDFTMPENTPIMAARDGIVIELEENNSLSGRDNALLGLANRVRIQHADGSIATYSHLAFQGVRVRVGDRVAAGSLIGLSGATGYASGPHLHFVVSELVRKDEGFAYVSVPIRFYVGKPAHVFVPQYLQAITANDDQPGREPPFLKVKRAERPVE